MRHSGSSTASDVHTRVAGVGVSEHTGQMHSAALMTTLQPSLYGALQPTVLHTSVGVGVGVGVGVKDVGAK